MAPNKLEKKNKPLSKNYVATFPNYVATKLAKNLDYVATKLEDKLCHDKVILCCNKAKRQTLLQQSFIMSRQSQKTNFVATKLYYVATKPKTNQKTNFVATKFYYVVTKLEDKLCRDKVLLCLDIVLGLTRSDVVAP